MGQIKSAYEIAMERTKGVAADKESLEAENYKKEGKKIISSYLGEPDYKLDNCLKDYKGKQLKWVREGMFQALLSNFVLPTDNNGIKECLKAVKGFYAIIGETKALNSIFKQIESFFNEYIEQRKTVKVNLEKQFAPRLKQKQEEVSRQLGGNVHLDPSSDPEFLKYLKQTLSQLEERYSEILTQVKNELRKMFEAA